ncbi:gamma-glutamyl-gamma-aminobutyrate hydrolase family protein [Streptomyces sp. NPDC087908]|uniref:gamma-glutamyl-gamma-aminobutyrate hydrolase family protein n=1 Tax=Streptomyces sp. NPDC087908 TaxID=3365820 RepID=UPI003821A4AC
MVDIPLIGISTYQEASVRWGAWDLPAAVLPAGYYRMIQNTGGLACLLPPADPAAAEQTVARIDGLVIAGGPDVEPAHYRAEPHPRTGVAHRHRDHWELALIHAALAQDKPLLGVCRGMQLLNVALGGTLVQHVPDVVGHRGHSGPPGTFARHVVVPVPGTRLAAAIPHETMVPTYHHQAVDRLGSGLTPSAFADDGTIEAIESRSETPFALGVQWHPEAGDDDRVFQALIQSASARRHLAVPQEHTPGRIREDRAPPPLTASGS